MGGAEMTEFVALLLVLVALVSPSIPSSSGNDDLGAAIKEMRSSGYFSFVMLLNMSPPNLIQGNITFLLPIDKVLSNNMLPAHGIPDFLLRHTIPSPLLFDYLQHIPTGSVLPTMKPGYLVRTDNQGRSSYFLNKVRINNPNVCVAGSSIRCHGIDGVLPVMASTVISPSTPCFNVSNGASEPEAPESAPPPSATDSTFPAMLPAASPSNQPQGSGSSPVYLVYGGVLRSVAGCAFAALWFVGFTRL